MKHPHFDMIMEWANDTSLVVEVLEFGQWSVTEEPRWCVDKKYRFKRETPTDLVYEFDISTKVYLDVPPQRKPLTDEEIDALELPPSGTATVRDLVRLIEAAHGIKGKS